MGWKRKYYVGLAKITRKYLAIQLSLETAGLLAISASTIHQVDEFIRLSLVLPKEMKMLGESKVLSFYIWC